MAGTSSLGHKGSFVIWRVVFASTVARVFTTN